VLNERREVMRKKGGYEKKLNSGFLEERRIMRD